MYFYWNLSGGRNLKSKQKPFKNAISAGGKSQLEWTDCALAKVRAIISAGLHWLAVRHTTSWSSSISPKYGQYRMQIKKFLSAGLPQCIHRLQLEVRSLTLMLNVILCPLQMFLLKLGWPYCSYCTVYHAHIQIQYTDVQVHFIILPITLRYCQSLCMSRMARSLRRCTVCSSYIGKSSSLAYSDSLHGMTIFEQKNEYFSDKWMDF